MAAIQLTMVQAFEVERCNRDLDALHNPAELRAIAKDLLKAWFVEKACTQQAIRNQLGH